MATVPNITISNLDRPPLKMQMYDAPGVMNSTWQRWFDSVWSRVGGASGNLIYDSASSSQTVSSLEPQLYAIRAELESQLTGILLTVIEQVQAEAFDPTGLISDIANQPVDFNPLETDVAQLLALAYDNAPVKSVFGRIGDVVATEGDYSLTLLSDVTIAAPASNQVLRYNGTNWANSAPTIVAPGYEEVVATAAQTVINTTVGTTSKGSGKAYLQVYVNGVFQQEGATKAYTVTGANQLTFNAGLALNDDVVIYSYS